MLDKYSLNREENIFLAKKELVTIIYNSAKLEGINTTYFDIKTILDGLNVPTMKLDEINCILNLRDAWNFILETIDNEINLDYICKVNSYVSRNESLEWGKLRTGKVGIKGVDYVPELPKEANVKKEISHYLEETHNTKKAIDLMLYLMREQIFWDGNKRTSMLIANKIMIENGCGIISINEDKINEFNKLLTDFYNTNEKQEIENFIYNNCIYGIDKE